MMGRVREDWVLPDDILIVRVGGLEVPELVIVVGAFNCISAPAPDVGAPLVLAPGQVQERCRFC